MSLFNLSDYDAVKSPLLNGRYISSSILNDVLSKLNNNALIEINEIGKSVKNKPISIIKIGFGTIKIFFWSQMHGNETTTTKAIIDFVNLLIVNNDKDLVKTLLNRCTLYIIPMLNPDGADAYTRVNANLVDLNRDAQNLSQPESKILRNAFNNIKPDYCFTLHGQRTIFGTESSGNSAVASFLAPAQDNKLSISNNREEAMRVIAYINLKLKKDLPNKIGVYDDAFNINCVGDNFQAQGTSTILFEAGHFHKDYNREESRKFIAFATLQALLCISANSVNENDYENYLQIPENNTLFFDILIKNTLISNDNKESVNDIGIIYEEVLNDQEVLFVPKIKSIGNLSSYFGHKTINANKKLVQEVSGVPIEPNADFCNIVIGNNKISLFPNNNLS